MEKLGEYDPIPVVRNTDYIPEAARIFGVKDPEVLRRANQMKREKTVTWDLGRIGWWITKGAEPTQRVRKLLRTVSSLMICCISLEARAARRTCSVDVRVILMRRPE